MSILFCFLVVGILILMSTKKGTSSSSWFHLSEEMLADYEQKFKGDLKVTKLTSELFDVDLYGQKFKVILSNQDAEVTFRLSPRVHIKTSAAKLLGVISMLNHDSFKDFLHNWNDSAIDCIRANQYSKMQINVSEISTLLNAYEEYKLQKVQLEDNLRKLFPDYFDSMVIYGHYYRDYFDTHTRNHSYSGFSYFSVNFKNICFLKVEKPNFNRIDIVTNLKEEFELYGHPLLNYDTIEGTQEVKERF